MKKFWTVLLAVAFVAGFAMSASAADVKFGGSYYVYGIYVDNPSLKAQGSKLNADQQAQAFYHQRLRIQTEFKIAEGLALVTRFDALEKQWGQGGLADGWRQKSAGANVGYDVTNRPSAGDGDARTQENIEFERAYIDFTTKIGRFMVGYQNFVAWGTMFLDTHVTRPGIKYFVPVGPLTVVAAIEKVGDSNSSGVPQQTDGDYNIYDIGAIYKFGAGEVGALYQYGDVRIARAAQNWSRKLHIFNPYAKMKFGPVYFEAEGVYGFGDWAKFDIAGQQDVSAEALGLYLHAKGDFGPAYVGGQFVYMRGDDPNTADKREGSVAAALVAGQAYDPCLILWNDALYGGSHRMNHLQGYAVASTSVFIDNTWFYQIYGGFKPVAKADIMMSLSYAYADKKPLNYVGDVYGTEIDLVAKYKLFDNLEYMVGAAYLWTGNYYKAANQNNNIDNNYMLIHKLTLSF
jgi:hypothetical protein